MASIISAGTTSNTALNLSADTTGVLQLASNGSTTALTIDTSQNVGIGTASPISLLHLSSGNPTLRIQSTGTGFASSVMQNTNSAFLYGVDNAAGNLSGVANGTFFINQNATPMLFATNNSERMRIDSSGNVLVGKTTSSDNTVGTLIAPTYLFVTRDGFAPLNLRRLTSSGNIAEFYSGTSGTSSGAISVASTGMTYTGTNGITFTATQTASADANTLDDYEEGTWTPNLEISASTAGITYTARGANYIKIGRQVTLYCQIELSAKGSNTGAVSVSNIPFAADGGVNNDRFVGAVRIYNQTNANSWVVGINNTNIFFRRTNATADDELTGSIINSNLRLYFTLSYQTAN